MSQAAPPASHEPPSLGTSVPPRDGAKPRRFVWLVLLALAALGAAFFWARGRRGGAAGTAPAGSGSAAAEARPVPVVVGVAEQKDVPIFLEGIGNATPLATVTVKTQVDGRLDKVLFTEGQSVKRGDVLAQVDPRPFMIALEQAEAAIAKDTAVSNNAKLNLQRYQNLVAQKLIPQQQVDDQKAAADQATAALAADHALADNARLQLDYARIKSPIDGVTGVRQVDPGNIVHPGDAGGIVVVTQLDPMAVVFTLPQDDLPRVAKQLAEGPLQVEAYARDGATLLGTGQLLLIDNQVNQQTATIKLKATFPNPKRLLWPNAFVKARLLLTTRSGALVVPATAIQRGPQGTFVYLLDPANKASVRPVVIDQTQDEIVILKSGLKPGDRIVIEGQGAIRPGATVAPRAPAAAGSAGAAPPAGAVSGARTRGAVVGGPP